MAKMSFDHKAFDKYLKQLDEIGGGATKQAVESALKASQKIVAENAHKAMAKHRDTGRTERAIIDNSPVVWETAFTASIDVGFDLDNGGLASIFLMYGTKLYGQPHTQPDRELYNAVYGTKTKKEIKAIQEKALIEAIERAMK